MAEFREIEKKWQKKWEEKKVFCVKEEQKKKKFYILEMFPYPSGSGLHMGHAFNYTIGDIQARFKRMQGYNVLYPMGYDSLGLPAENAAIKTKTHPKVHTENAIHQFIKQQKSLGLSYDWTRMVQTHNPDYYKWDQWIFLQMLKKGKAYRKKAPVNWCPKCETVLANEQVHNGKCWRHTDTDVEIKHLEQWFLKITDYAEDLFNTTKTLDYPERIKTMQENWIGKSQGTEIIFEINGKKWNIFTTRADTIYGVTFMVISLQHPELAGLVTKENKKQVESLLKKLKSNSEKELASLEKEGAFTGSYAVNPLTKEKVPIYAGNFVVADYGAGMVMAVPAHDQRDFDFAKKYKIPVKQVIEGKITKEQAFTGDGKLINSGKFNGLQGEKARDEITKHLQSLKLGKKKTQYKLKDWLVSRQRYWGTPIPVVYCEKCGIVPVPEKELPVQLPTDITFGKGNPILTSKSFSNTKCPKCSGKARRETDTMDTFVNSSWYFLRYCDPKNEKKIFSREKAKYWMPVDLYIGGAEHACMHLIYYRFYTRFLKSLGLITFDEPVKKLFNQGMLHGSDGFVMAKSRGNVVDPLDMVGKYCADTLRFYLVSNSSPDKDYVWSDSAIEGSSRFLKKVFSYFENVKTGKSSEKTQSRLNSAIKEATQLISEMKYNLAIIQIRELFDSFRKEESREVLESFLKLLHPFCPHLTEEMWEKMGNKNFLSAALWPVADEKKINQQFEQQENLVEQLIADINHILGIVREKKSKVYVYVLPKEKILFEDGMEEVKRRTGLEAELFSVDDKKKYDPENKAKKARPGKPALLLE